MILSFPSMLRLSLRSTLVCSQAVVFHEALQSDSIITVLQVTTFTDGNLATVANLFRRVTIIVTVWIFWTTQRHVIGHVLYVFQKYADRLAVTSLEEGCVPRMSAQQPSGYAWATHVASPNCHVLLTGNQVDGSVL